jgi:methylthioribose-1-phosphate isomerase
MEEQQQSDLIKPIEWLEGKVIILDQTRLPESVVFIETADYREVVEAIKTLRVRGAPAIGVATAYGIALGCLGISASDKQSFKSGFDEILDEFKRARPTAVNLFKAAARMEKALNIDNDIEEIKEELILEAKNIHSEENAATTKLSLLGAELIKDGFTILTHCNTGPLATAGYGTALGVIYAAKEQGKNVNVIATETRPLLQGARLTTWELMTMNIPVRLIVDSAAGSLLHNGKIDCVIVGADRIAENGDTANKIGTYSLAVLAHENNVPFYIAAPVSTIDFNIKTGKQIIVEERASEEVTTIDGKQITPTDVKALNPAFDVTPNKHITAIITDKCICKKPFKESIGGLNKT